MNLQTSLGKLDVLCELSEGEGYEQLERDTVEARLGDVTVRVLELSKLIEVKARANRSKDRAVLPLLIATLDELKGRRG